MCEEKKKKCSTKTRKILYLEKKRIMTETIENLKELRESFETNKQTA